MSKFNRQVLSKVLSQLKNEGIVRNYTPIWWRVSHRELRTQKWLGENGYRGCWCFVNDLDKVMRKSDMGIAFAGKSLEESKFVAKRIVDVLREAGFNVEWDGSVRRKILVNIDSPILDKLPKPASEVLSSTLEQILNVLKKAA